MEFNESKCKVLHIGKNNPRYGNQMNGVNLEVSDKKKDVGVMIQEDLKPSKQCSTAAAKANSILGQMARSFSYRNKTVWISARSQDLYKLMCVQGVLRQDVTQCVQQGILCKQSIYYTELYMHNILIINHVFNSI